MFGGCVGFGPTGVLAWGRSDASMTDAPLYPRRLRGLRKDVSRPMHRRGSLAHVGEHPPGTPALSSDAHARIYSVI